MKKIEKTVIAHIHLWIFCTILGIGGILFFILPKTDKSELENRNLAPFPILTITNLANGRYMDSLDACFSDHFPFRDNLVNIGQKIKKLHGFWFGKLTYIASKNVQKISQSDTCVALLNDTINFDTIPFDPQKMSNVGGYVLYNGMAFQCFGGNVRMAKAYATMVNKYKSEIDQSINVFCMIIPSNAEFYKPKDMRLGVSESRNIRQIYSFLDKSVIAVDAVENIRKHQDEYIYYNTDHHWTGLGAYYAYEAFCRAANITPTPLKDLDHRNNGRFYGSLYAQTLDDRLKINGDSMVVYKIKNKYNCYSMNDLLTKSTHAFLYYGNARNYGVYLGGDLPIMRVDSDNKNGRKLVIIKNSFGNALAPYMVQHFEQVFIIDYRYFKGSVEKLIKQFKITDILFPTSSFAANTVSHVGRMRSIFKGVKVVKQDSTKTK